MITDINTEDNVILGFYCSDDSISEDIFDTFVSSYIS